MTANIEQEQHDEGRDRARQKNRLLRQKGMTRTNLHQTGGDRGVMKPGQVVFDDCEKRIGAAGKGREVADRESRPRLLVGPQRQIERG